MEYWKIYVFSAAIAFSNKNKTNEINVLVSAWIFLKLGWSLKRTKCQLLQFAIFGRVFIQFITLPENQHFIPKKNGNGDEKMCVCVRCSWFLFSSSAFYWFFNSVSRWSEKGMLWKDFYTVSRTYHVFMLLFANFYAVSYVSIHIQH